MRQNLSYCHPLPLPNLSHRTANRAQKTRCSLTRNVYPDVDDPGHLSLDVN
jgi:hypothetical protein